MFYVLKIPIKFGFEPQTFFQDQTPDHDQGKNRIKTSL